METKRYEGDNILTGGASLEQFREALEDPDTRSVTMHKPGEIIVHSDGVRYQVQDNGEWRKLTEEEYQHILSVELPSERFHKEKNNE